MNTRILVVEDDKKIQELIVEFLSSESYIVDSADDGLSGFELYKENAYDLIILDVMMPILDGLSLCKMIRKSDDTTPIIFLTALGSEEDEIKGFDSKADDYITKPFSFNVLIRRVQSMLKRSTMAVKNEATLKFEGLSLNLNTYKVYVDGDEIELTLKEFNILKLLINSFPGVVSREVLLDRVWGYDYYGDSRVIDAHIKNVRKKIKYDYIKTIKGIGYVLTK